MKFSHVLMMVAAVAMAGAIGAGCKRHSKAYKQAMSIKKQSCGCVGAGMEYKCYKKALKRRNKVWVGLKKFRSRSERRTARRAINKADKCLKKLSKKYWKRSLRKGLKGLKRGGKLFKGGIKGLNKALRKAAMRIKKATTK